MRRSLSSDMMKGIRLSHLCVTTLIVASSTAAWAYLTNSDQSYMPLLTGAWTMTVVFWALFIGGALTRNVKR